MCDQHNQLKNKSSKDNCCCSGANAVEKNQKDCCGGMNKQQRGCCKDNQKQDPEEDE